MKKILSIALGFAISAVVSAATFSPGQVLNAADLNAAFSTAAITSGTISGTSITNSVITNSTGAFSLLSAPSVSITGGLIDGTNIGTVTPGTGAFTTLTTALATITGGTIDSTTIGGATPAAATVSTLSNTVASGVGFTQTLAASAAAATTGYQITFNNTQSNVVEGVVIDMGSSAQAHDAFMAKGSNAAAADAFMANMQTGFTGNLFHGSVNSVDQYRVDASGNTIQAGLLTQGDPTAPAGQVQLGGMFSTNTASGAGLIVRKSFTAAGNSSALALMRSRGTNSSPTALVSGDTIAAVNSAGYDGANYTGSAAIQFSVDSTVSSGIVPGNITFVTTNTSGSGAAALKIDSSQNVLVVGPGGLGYGAGSGGTVTQTTSRTTGVTLNKASGQITMFTAAGSTTPASFTVTDSAVGANDVPVIAIKSGATNTYTMEVTSVAAGSFAITFWTTGGTASDTPVLQFNIIKGSIN